MWAIRRTYRKVTSTSILFTLVAIFVSVVLFNLLLTFIVYDHSSKTSKSMSSSRQLAYLKEKSNPPLFDSLLSDKKHTDFSKEHLFINKDNTINVNKMHNNSMHVEFLDSFQNKPDSKTHLILEDSNNNKTDDKFNKFLGKINYDDKFGIRSDTKFVKFSELNGEENNRKILLDKSDIEVRAFNSTQPNSSWKESDKKLKHFPVTLEEYRSGQSTGNLLIDNYGQNNLQDRGEMGKPVVLTPEEELEAERAMSKFNLNTVASDATPLNRLVPDSRISRRSLYKHDWRSNSDPEIEQKLFPGLYGSKTWRMLKEPLETYIFAHFPQGLVRIIRLPERRGLINARMRGSQEATGDVLIFFDSHMEVNNDWLPPLLTEIARDKTVVAMATLDYVQRDTLEYKYNHDYLTRYGWNWKMVFFETYFRKDQIGDDPRNPREGATMVGAAFAIDKQFFLHLGGYDESMTVWGGENLEMGWRVWLCGGRLMHLPCSRIGHVPRGQPYSFPGGREQVEHFNYKRAIEVWMGNYSRFVYNIFPDMKTLDVGDIGARLNLKSRLGCKDFKWYLDHVWPELAIFDENVKIWGRLENAEMKMCLDNNDFLFQYQADVLLNSCDRSIDRQAFSLTKDRLLRTSLQCVVCHEPLKNPQVKLEDCIVGSRDKWRYTKNKRLVHVSSKLCLEATSTGPLLSQCAAGQKKSQIWTFRPVQL